MRLSLLSVVGCLLCTGVASAQYTQSQFGSSMGGMQQSSFGGGTSTYGSFGNRTLGGGVSGRSTAGGSTSQGTPSLQTLQQDAGGVQGNERFLRQNRQGAFVGADTADAGNARSIQAQGQAASGLNSLFGPQGAFSQFSRMNRQDFNNQNQNQGPGRKPLRFRISADIATSNVSSSPTTVSREFEARLKKIPAMAKAGSIQVTMQGRTAVLTGSVKSERDRELAEGLAMLEPGISAVRNELVVDASGPTAEELPAPRR
jgi:hypothetical protein